MAGSNSRWQTSRGARRAHRTMRARSGHAEGGEAATQHRGRAIGHVRVGRRRGGRPPSRIGTARRDRRPRFGRRRCAVRRCTRGPRRPASRSRPSRSPSRPQARAARSRSCGCSSAAAPAAARAARRCTPRCSAAPSAPARRRISSGRLPHSRPRPTHSRPRPPHPYPRPPRRERVDRRDGRRLVDLHPAALGRGGDPGRERGRLHPRAGRRVEPGERARHVDPRLQFVPDRNS